MWEGLIIVIWGGGGGMWGVEVHLGHPLSCGL